MNVLLRFLILLTCVLTPDLMAKPSRCEDVDYELGPEGVKKDYEQFTSLMQKVDNENYKLTPEEEVFVKKLSRQTSCLLHFELERHADGKKKAWLQGFLDRKLPIKNLNDERYSDSQAIMFGFLHNIVGEFYKNIRNDTLGIATNALDREIYEFLGAGTTSMIDSFQKDGMELDYKTEVIGNPKYKIGEKVELNWSSTFATILSSGAKDSFVDALYKTTQGEIMHQADGLFGSHLFHDIAGDGPGDGSGDGPGDGPIDSPRHKFDKNHWGVYVAGKGIKKLLKTTVNAIQVHGYDLTGKNRYEDSPSFITKVGSDYVHVYARLLTAQELMDIEKAKKLEDATKEYPTLERREIIKQNMRVGESVYVQPKKDTWRQWAVASTQASFDFVLDNSMEWFVDSRLNKLHQLNFRPEGHTLTKDDHNYWLPEDYRREEFVKYQLKTRAMKALKYLKSATFSSVNQWTSAFYPAASEPTPAIAPVGLVTINGTLRYVYPPVPTPDAAPKK